MVERNQDSERSVRPRSAKPELQSRSPLISLINLKQVQPDGFETQPTGAVLMRDATRRVVLAALVQRKKEELTHPLLDAKVPIGLLPLLQARLLARHLRGELPAYPAFVAK